MNLTDLQTFSWVAITGSITGAAERMGVPKSTVSRRVQRLEDSMGQALLRRTARSVALTEYGRALHSRTVDALRQLRQTARAMETDNDDPSGVLRVTTTPSFGQSPRVTACLRDFVARFPEMSLELSLTNRVVDLVDEGFDVGLRLHRGPLPDTHSLMSRRLLHFRWALYASPEYLARFAPPQVPQDLRTHRLAIHTLLQADRGGDSWWCGEQRAEAPYAAHVPSWTVDDSGTLERLALSGAGIVTLETMTGDQWVKRGELIRVLPAFHREAGTASIVWPTSRYVASHVRAFVDHAVAALAVDRSQLSTT